MKATTKKTRKGQMGLGGVPNTVITLGVVAIVFVVIYLVLAGLGATTTDGPSTRAIGNFTTALTNIVSFAPTWGTVIAAGVMLAIVIGGLYFFVDRRGGL